MPPAKVFGGLDMLTYQIEESALLREITGGGDSGLHSVLKGCESELWVL